MNQLPYHVARAIDLMMNLGTGAYMSRYVSLLEARENGVPFTLTWEGAVCDAWDAGRLPFIDADTPHDWQYLPQYR